MTAETPGSRTTALGSLGAAQTDVTLLERTSSGDHEAFAALFERLAPTVYGLARRVVVDPALAEQVTQDVLMTLWTKATSFDSSRGTVRTWVLTMTHRRALDAARRPRRDVSGDPAVTGSRRTAVELAYFDGLTEEQIAHALDVPQASVAERIRDEMRRLTARRPPPGPTPPSPAGE